MMELKVKGKPDRGGQRQLSFIQGINDLDFTNAGNGTAESHQFLAVEFIGTTEAVDDLGDGFSGDGIPLIMGELVVGDDGSVLIGSFGGAQVHDCLQ